MKKNAIKVDFAIGDGLLKKADEVYALSKKIDAILNEAYIPIRQIDSAIRKLYANPAKDEFQDFVKKLQSLEAEYSSEVNKAKAMAKELGVELPKLSWINEVNGILKNSQRAEQTARQDMNAYSDARKAAVALLPKLK